MTRYVISYHSADSFSKSVLQEIVKNLHGRLFDFVLFDGIYTEVTVAPIIEVYVKEVKKKHVTSSFSILSVARRV